MGFDAQQRAVAAAALDMGVDVVGGIPHFERTMADGAASVAGAWSRRSATSAYRLSDISSRPR